MQTSLKQLIFPVVFIFRVRFLVQQNFPWRNQTKQRQKKRSLQKHSLGTYSPSQISLHEQCLDKHYSSFHLAGVSLNAVPADSTSQKFCTTARDVVFEFSSVSAASCHVLNHAGFWSRQYCMSRARFQCPQQMSSVVGSRNQSTQHTKSPLDLTNVLFARPAHLL